MPQKTPDENAKLTLDEGAFQRLLSAAFVIQEHNDSLKNQTPDTGEFKASDLSEIAETQNLIRGKRLDLLTAAAVIVERSQKISHAAAGAIALLSKRELSYISSSGNAAPPVGTTVSLDESLSAECLRTGQFLSLPNLKAVARPHAELFLSRGMQSFASVPIYQNQRIAGVMELFFSRPNATDAATLRSCQLLAGLLTGTVSAPQQQAVQPSLPPSPPPAGSLDRLKSQLDRMLEAEDPDALPALLQNILQEPATVLPAENASSGSHSVSSDSANTDSANIDSANIDSVNAAPAGTNIHGREDIYTDRPPVVRCGKCGCPLEADESFCGLCGTARTTASEPAKMAPKPVPSAAFNTAKTTPGADRSPSPSKPSASLEPVTPPPVRAEKPNSALSSPLLPESFSEPLAGPPDIPEKSEELPPELQEILARFPEEPEITSPPSSNSTSASSKIFDSSPLNFVTPSTPLSKDARLQHSPPEPSLSEKPIETKPIETKRVETKSPETKLTAPNPQLDPVVAASTPPSAQAAAADTPANPQWKSASETRAWLESVKAPPQRKHWMAEHRANLYLAAAAVLLLVVLFGVGMPADLQSGKPQLSWFDSMLVNLGLAEAPAAPVLLGNPATKVWVDLHTALYYCPNAELYGKTRGGKFETQREAQQDQFEPASRHACP